MKSTEKCSGTEMLFEGQNSREFINISFRFDVRTTIHQSISTFITESFHEYILCLRVYVLRV